MKATVLRETLKRKRYSEIETNRVLKLAVPRNKSSSVTAKYKSSCYLDRKVGFRNRCVLTGRGRGVNKLSGLSRISMRELARNGCSLGVRKGIR